MRCFLCLAGSCVHELAAKIQSVVPLDRVERYAGRHAGLCVGDLTSDAESEAGRHVDDAIVTVAKLNV